MNTNIIMYNNPSGSCDSDFLLLAGVTDPNFICILNYMVTFVQMRIIAII